MPSDHGRRAPSPMPSLASGRPFTPMSIFPPSRAGTPTPALIVPMPDDDEQKERDPNNKGSLAVRAMRSVRSLARIGSWAQLKNGSSQATDKENPRRGKGSNDSTSSWEVGEVSIVRSLIPGAGFDNGTIRSGLSATSTASYGTNPNRLSSLSANSAVEGRHPTAQRLSTLSTASSLAPVSTYSGDSRSSFCSSDSAPSRRSSTQSQAPVESQRVSRTSSIKWDDNVVETVKEKRRGGVERRGGTTIAKTAKRSNSIQSTDTRKSSQKSVEARQRGRISTVFPQVVHQPPTPAASVQGHSDDTGSGTPIKPAVPRPRPVSENLLGVKPRPTGIVGEDNVEAAISVLHAATTDLAYLINRLDLQATPEGPGAYDSRGSTWNYGTPQQKAENVSSSPSKKSPRESSSASSLRPYGTHRASTLSTSTTDDTVSSYGPVFSLPARGTAASPIPESAYENEPSSPLSPVFKKSVEIAAALPSPAPTPSGLDRSLKLSGSKSRLRLKSSKRELRTQQTLEAKENVRLPSNHAHSESGGSFRSSFRSAKDIDDSQSTTGSEDSHQKAVPRAVKSREDLMREMAYNGTFGDFETIKEDEDTNNSDIPDELQLILAYKSSVGSEEEVLSPTPPKLVVHKATPRHKAHASLHKKSASLKTSPAPTLPPNIPLPIPSELVTPIEPSGVSPVFRAMLIDDKLKASHLTGSEPSSPRSSCPDGDTKKSFDFTAQIKKLNESGDGNRKSFMEELEKAFQEPAKLDGFDFEKSAPLAPFDPKEFVKTLDFSVKNSVTHGSSVMQSVEASQFEDIHAPAVIKRQSQLSMLSSDSFNASSPLVMQNNVRSRTSVTSRASDGQLNSSFKFGGLSSVAGPMVLSDARLPTLNRVRSISESIVEEDSSIMKSIYGHAITLPEVPPVPSMPRPRVASDTSSKRHVRENEASISHVRNASEISYQSPLESFQQVRNKFEFNPDRPSYLPDEDFVKRKHAQRESVFSIASVSSYGQVLSGGLRDPFNFGYNSRPVSEDMSNINDTFSFLRHDPHTKRNSTDSDMSSFFVRGAANPVARRGHRANDSIVSVLSGNGPPVSMYNRSHGQSFGHSRTDSWASGSSLAHAYAQGANGGRAAWARHYREQSFDTHDPSDFSAKRLGRPGLGDKMLSSAAEHGAALSSISASPPESARAEGNGFDSVDDFLNDRPTSTMDSIFETTNSRTSVSSDSIFGNEHVPQRCNPKAPQFRPVSIVSSDSRESPKEDDTMLTMLNGDHVRRKSIGSSFEASPCLRVEKLRGHERARNVDEVDSSEEAVDDSMAEAKRFSVQFGADRMDMARRGLLARKSLENSCLIADGEDFARSLGPPVLTVITHTSRGDSRPTSCHSEYSLSATPPLCLSDGSQSGGSQSSIDLGQLDSLLTGATQPSSTTSRLRARGAGHRRHAQISDSSAFSSIVDAIEEEPLRTQAPPTPAMMSFGAGFESLSMSEKQALIENSEVMIADGEEEDENGYVLRRYWALRSEADETVAQSKIIWQDTPFSMVALQSFMPPHEPEAMKALLEQSQVTYGPLPSELRVRKIRSRTSSRASPYPQRSILKSPIKTATVLQNVPIYENVEAPMLDVLKPMTPLVNDFKKSVRGAEMLARSGPRPRVGSGARRVALGWSKRKTPKPSEKSFANKENDSFSMVMSPTDSLRIVRPRPRGRVR